MDGFPIHRFALFLRDIAFLSFQCDRTNESWRIYCKYRNRAKAVIRSTRRRYFSHVFKDLNSVGLWKILKGYGCLVDESPDIKIDADTMNGFFVDCAITYGGKLHLDDMQDIDSSFSFHCVSELEFIDAMNKVKS